MPEFKKNTKGFKMKGWSPFTKIAPPQPIAQPYSEGRKRKKLKEDELNENESSSQIQPLLPDFPHTPFTKKTDPVKKPVGPVTPQTKADYGKRQVFNLIQDQKRKKKPIDDDSDKMTPEQEAKHRAKVLEYNKKRSKPLNATLKKKIKERLSKMDKNDPEAKLLQDMLNLKKNK